MPRWRPRTIGANDLPAENGTAIENCEGGHTCKAHTQFGLGNQSSYKAAGDLKVPLRGMILGETDDVIRFRVEQAWDIDIYKNMVLAVEQDQWARILVN